MPPAGPVISHIVVLEIPHLGAWGRITDALAVVLARVAEGFRMIPINPGMDRLALELGPPHDEPFDRVITATAKTHAIPALARDRSTTDSGAVTTLG